ncbi:serine/threonine protein kinase, partial [bacterium]|nr:serine/threonine protein kinase [bacterium]
MTDSEEIFVTEDDFRKRYEYRSSDLLGEGGFAQVYKAFDRQFNEFIALKFYNKEQKGKYDVLHEIKNLRSFSHKNVIRVHDAFVVRCERAGTYSFVQVGVLEYANGGNLRNFIETNPSENEFIEVLLGILEGLKYLHSEKKIIHRDLSPENILMCNEGGKWIPRISDFGISKKIDIGALAGAQKKSTQLLGKIEYMAPEQFQPEKYGIDGNINTNVDLWAFGIILYELFHHVTPFARETAESQLSALQAIINDPVPILDDIPFPYRKVIERCLVKDAKKRAQDSAELASLILSGADNPAYEYRKTLSLKDIAVKKRHLGSVGILAALCLLIAGSFLIGRNISKKKPAKAISEISILMNDQKYPEALKLINGLSRRIREIPEISSRERVCQIRLARDSMLIYLSAMQFPGALSYLATLDEDVRS